MDPSDDDAKNDKRLKNQALEMFDPVLAEAVREKVDASRATQDGEDFESILTAYQADAFFDELKVGEIRGLPTVTWVGMDEFLYEPHPTQPFSYRTSSRFGGRLIKPGRMITDGGSIPQALRAFSKFSSWSYAPAFIIHDWIFHAKKLKIPNEHPWTFQESADIMAEIMKTMMVTDFQSADGAVHHGGFVDHRGERRVLGMAEDVLYLMHIAVSSFVAENLWHDDSTATAVA